jgi:hypothetical protein
MSRGRPRGWLSANDKTGEMRLFIPVLTAKVPSYILQLS